MSILIAISALLLVASCCGQEYFPGIPVNAVSRTSRTLQRNAVPFAADEEKPLPPNLCLGKFGPFCLNCHTLLTCANTVINSQTCTSIDPAKPFCSPSVSACTSASPTVNCYVPFRCTSTGVFPNPYDCTGYYLCSDSSAESSTAYRCPTNYVFDSVTGLCKERKVATDCKTISCAELSNRYQIFAGDKSILAYCANTSTIQETILFRCKDYVNMQYNAETLQCQYVCTAEGRFPDRIDCRKYYECYKVGTLFQVEHMTCPGGFSYNSNRQQCTVLPPASQCTPELD